MTYYSMPDSSQTPFYDWMVLVNQNSNAPLVHSVSYGEIENSPDATSNNDRVNNEFKKAAARGLTIMVASGDDGVGNFPARTSKANCGFNPSFPATSPYVLAVSNTIINRIVSIIVAYITFVRRLAQPSSRVE